MNNITKRIMELTNARKDEAFEIQVILDSDFGVDYSEAEQTEIDAAIFEAYRWFITVVLPARELVKAGKANDFVRVLAGYKL